MGLNFKRESETQEVPVFVKIIEDIPGGGILDTTGLTEGDEVAAGYPIHFDEATRKAHLVKQAEVYEAAAGGATTYKIKKGSLILDSENLAVSVGGLAVSIALIDTSNANYDSVVVDATLGAASAGTVFIVSSAAGASAGAFAKKPNCLLRNKVEVGVNADVALVRRGTVYNRRTVSKAAADVKSELSHIIFSEQF